MLLWRQVLAVLLVAVFFTNLAVYGYVAGWSPPPVVFVAALVVASAPLWLAPGAAYDVLTSRLTHWTVLFLMLTSAWVAVQGAPEELVELLQSRITTSVFTVVAILVLADPQVHRTARLALCGAVIFGGLLNFYEVMHPMTFSTTFGRSAGWYINPNTSAGTLTFGIILGIGALRPRYREAFLAFGLVAVMLTLSRGAVAGWVIVLPALVLGRTIRVGRVLKAAALVILVGIGVLWATGAMPRVMTALELSREQRTRLMFSGGTEGDRMATNERVDAATRALEMFTEHPIVGRGLGATEATAHNMYLQLAAEQGLIGLLLFPLLIYAVVRGTGREDRGLAFATVGFLAWWGFFSHTLYDEFQTLFVFAVMSGIAAYPSGAGSTDTEQAVEDTTEPVQVVEAAPL